MSALRKISRIREILKGVEIDENKGTLTAYGERFLFIPVKLIHSIEDHLTQMLGPVTATSFQYEIGKEGGRVYMGLFRKAGFKPESLRDMQKATERFGTLAGWGKLTVVDSDPKKRIVRIRWTNGLSVRNRKGRTPVCHFMRGLMTGGTEVAYGQPCESIELQCQGKGDDFCEAVIGDPVEIVRLANTRF